MNPMYLVRIHAKVSGVKWGIGKVDWAEIMQYRNGKLVLVCRAKLDWNTMIPDWEHIENCPVSLDQ